MKKTFKKILFLFALILISSCKIFSQNISETPKTVTINGVKHLAVTENQAKQIAKDLSLRFHYEAQFKDAQTSYEKCFEAYNLKLAEIVERNTQIEALKAIEQTQRTQIKQKDAFIGAQIEMIRKSRKSLSISKKFNLVLSISTLATIGYILLK